MESGVFGRTNQIFPAKWLRLVAPSRELVDLAGLAKAALDAQTVIDISANPALWGGYMRATTATLMAVGPFDLARAVDEQQAHDLVLAHLIETLSSVGRESLDFYFLRVDGPLKEFQISGALIALEEARQEGNVKFVGVAAIDVFASQSLIHFHDAFELMLLDAARSAEHSGIRALARSRRMAVIDRSDDGSMEARSGEAVLISVASAADIKAAMSLKVPA